MKIQSLEEYTKLCELGKTNPEELWGRVAQTFSWKKPWNRVLEYNFSEGKSAWFKDGKLNVTENILDRHLPQKANQTALIWEPNNPSDTGLKISYQELYERVCQFANVLKKAGVKKGDAVCIYLPMIPELVVAMLACARIGAIHSVIFAGFSAKSIADRVTDLSAKLLITADGLNRGEKHLVLKSIVDEALNHCPTIEKCVIVQHTKASINWNNKRDFWWHELMQQEDSDCPAEPMDSEDPLFVLYTSGSTGKPKGLVHTCGGYMVYAAYTFTNVFNYQEGDIHWCTADIGWITGHSYIVYGPLLCGATTLIFEGIPTYPSASRYWEICHKHSVNIFYTSPTAIRSLMAYGNAFLPKNPLKMLHTIGSVGEPINKEAWDWFSLHIGNGKCPLVDTWWQTETGGILLSALSGISTSLPTYAGKPLPGIYPLLLDEKAQEITNAFQEGFLCFKQPWPGLAKTIHGDHTRYKETYFSRFQDCYFSGDGALRNDDGQIRIIGRVDDVINVSGHRIGTAEVENAINLSEGVVESAVVGFPHAIKGQGICAFVITNNRIAEFDTTQRRIVSSVENQIGKIALPEKIIFVTDLPKTRSGKIMRRILRKIVHNETDSLGDTSTLINPDAVEKLITAYKAQ